MSWEFDPSSDCSNEQSEEEFIMLSLMERVRDEAIEKLSTLERAALNDDLAEFIYRYKESMCEEFAETCYD